MGNLFSICPRTEQPISEIVVDAKNEVKIEPKEDPIKFVELPPPIQVHETDSCDDTYIYVPEDKLP
jgi:hypothetical protein